jgi:carbon-monoxide dehydrogenase medium subunit
MKPVDFDYERPDSVAEVLRLLARGGPPAKILAGGQSLIPLLVARTLRPACVIDIGRIAELRYIREDGAWLRIGATARQADCADSPLVQAGCPLLAEAIGWVATLPVRNLGTVVGSLAQRNAISQIPTVAIALGARLTVADASGRRREVAAADFLDPASPGTLRPDELVLEASFPRQPAAQAWDFIEVQRRHAHYAVVGVAATFLVDRGGELREPRVAVSGVGPCPVRLASVEAALAGRRPTPEVFRAASLLALADPAMRPVDDLLATADYRRDVTPALVRRALGRARARIA